MKLGELLKCNNYFHSKIMQEMRQGGLVPDLFLIFKNVSDEVKERDLQLSFNIF